MGSLLRWSTRHRAFHRIVLDCRSRPASCTRTRPQVPFSCTFVSDNVDPIMGFSAWEMLEGSPSLAIAPAPRRRAASVCRGQTPSDSRWRHGRISLPSSRRQLPLDLGYVQGHSQYGHRPATRSRWIVGPIYRTGKQSRARTGGAPSHHERPASSNSRSSSDCSSLMC